MARSWWREKLPFGQELDLNVDNSSNITIDQKQVSFILKKYNQRQSAIATKQLVTLLSFGATHSAI